jgi:hypothetical protein
MNPSSQGGGLPPHAIPLQAPHCVVRRQQEGYLFYNPHTDEMHLVPAAGYAVYAQCDGVRTVAEIQQWMMPAASADTAVAEAGIVQFLAALAARGLVEVDDAHD